MDASAAKIARIDRAKRALVDTTPHDGTAPASLDAQHRATTCAICLCDVAPGEPGAAPPACGHTFHRACIEVAIEAAGSVRSSGGQRAKRRIDRILSCPICARPIVADDDDDNTTSSSSSSSDGDEMPAAPADGVVVHGTSSSSSGLVDHVGVPDHTLVDDVDRAVDHVTVTVQDDPDDDDAS
mmetsp:Transcript_16033/g.64707  ORF Transcript_16033/g.64707 Transcript_16033/m.64707 type:complete len:183 (+) Transcript_16033:410-958(+)